MKELHQHGGSILGSINLRKAFRRISDVWENAETRSPGRDLKRGEVSSLPIYYNITISWLHPLNSFRFIFSLCDSENDLIWTGHFAIYVRCLFGWRYISSLHSTNEPQERRNSCPLLRSCFIGSCHLGVSKRFSRSISLAVCLLSFNMKAVFLLDIMVLTQISRSRFKQSKISPLI